MSQEIPSKEKKLKLSDHLGYGSASMGDAISYTIVGSYFLFFMTTIAGIKPATGGAIIAIGSLWNAFFNPIVGYISDRIYTKHGRRRPLIFIFSIPLGMSLLLMFTDLPLPGFAKAIYFGILLMIMWSGYTAYFVPYLALGVAYTGDYDQRTKLRLYASFFNMLGAIITMTLPSILVEQFTKHGLSAGQAWSILGGIVGAITTVSIMITFFVSKEKDPPCTKEQIASGKAGLASISIPDLFREYVSVALLKPSRWLIIGSIASLICYSMVMSDIVYFLTYCMGYSSTMVSMCMLARALIGIVLIPVMGRMTLLIDKRWTLILLYILAVAGNCFIRFTGGVGNTGMLCLYILMSALCTCTYWTIVPSTYYDLCDYDRLHSGKDRQGTILSFQGLVEAVACGIGGLLLGSILQSGGFDGTKETQGPEALAMITDSTTIIPALFLLVAMVAFYKYPITRRSHEEIMLRLRDKDAVL